MKKIYRLLARVIVMLIAVAGMSSHAAPNYTLFPPTNLHVIPIEVCTAYLTWDKPLDNGGLPPAGLLGYKIYRNGALVGTLHSPDSLSYYDYIDDAGGFHDSVTAWYDLTSYGYPGQYGESDGPGYYIWISCGGGMPFFEPWDIASFTYQKWRFEPSQGNWVMNTAEGNPIPAAAFSGSPQVTNYSYLLRSFLLSVASYSCANVYFEFDAKSVIINPTAQEKLIPEVYYDSIWHPLDSLVNNGSTAWLHYSRNITGGAGKSIRVGFLAKGLNSSDIDNWEIDNIHVYSVCFAPTGFNLNRNGNTIHLAWSDPCPGKKANPDVPGGSILIGYNIYRTDSSGIVPFHQINSSLVAGITYDDVLPLVNGNYCYYVTAVYKDTMDLTPVLCEPASDTLCLTYTSGIADQSPGGVNIYPNPVTDVLKISSDQAISSVEILDFVGVSIYNMTGLDLQTISIPIKDQPAGIYIIKIRIGDRTVVRKVVKQ